MKVDYFLFTISFSQCKPFTVFFYAFQRIGRLKDGRPPKGTVTFLCCRMVLLYLLVGNFLIQTRTLFPEHNKISYRKDVNQNLSCVTTAKHLNANKEIKRCLPSLDDQLIASESLMKNTTRKVKLT